MNDVEFYTYIAKIPWRQRKAIAQLGLASQFHGNMPGIGVRTLDRVQADQIIERAGVSRNGEPIFRLTKDGWRVHQALGYGQASKKLIGVGKPQGSPSMNSTD